MSKIRKNKKLVFYNKFLRYDVKKIIKPNGFKYFNLILA